jgi:hypothetical protein
MVSLPHLWLPILLSAVIVFAASCVIHMLLPYHRKDFSRIPGEDQVMDALRKIGLLPGDYMIPCAQSPKETKSPEFIDKMTKGPVGLLTVFRSGPPAMGKQLVGWFIYCLVVGVFAAYIAGRALPPGEKYLAVFRFAGCTAFVGYSLALWQASIWYKKPWKTTVKSMIDGLIYGLLTGGTFGWLWPSMPV